MCGAWCVERGKGWPVGGTQEAGVCWEGGVGASDHKKGTGPGKAYHAAGAGSACAAAGACVMRASRARWCCCGAWLLVWCQEGRKPM